MTDLEITKIKRRDLKVQSTVIGNNHVITLRFYDHRPA